MTSTTEFDRQTEMNFFGFLHVNKRKRGTGDNKQVKQGLPEDAAKYSPYEFNAALFERLYRDMDNRALPMIPCPTTEEVAEFEKGREYCRLENSALVDSADIEKLRENQPAPVEDAIWVEKILAIYLDDLVPMLGLAHWREEARKKLYQYRGHQWYTASELFPNDTID